MWMSCSLFSLKISRFVVRDLRFRDIAHILRRIDRHDGAVYPAVLQSRRPGSFQPPFCSRGGPPDPDRAAASMTAGDCAIF